MSSPATHSLDIELLDRFRVCYRSVPVEGLKATRLQSLFCYLVVHLDQPQLRSRLATVFWPESGEGQARTNLRQLLHHLRSALPDADDVLAVDSLTVQFRHDVRVEADVNRFRALLARANRAAADQDYPGLIDALERAVSEYRGELLPGCYDEWLLAERERLQELYRGALQRLTELLEEAQELERGIGYARKLLELDPLDESSCSVLLRMLAARGDRTAAQRVYHRLVEDLNRELGVAPGAQTQALFARLLQSRPAGTDAPNVSKDAAQPELLEARPPLIGRRAEWLHLLHSWHSVPQAKARFVLISGAMGAGKTRLAEELLRIVRGRDTSAALARCFSSASALPLAPVREWLRSDGMDAGLAKLDRVWLSEISRLVPEILTRHAGVPEPEPLRDSWQRQRFFEALARAVLSRPSPLLLVLDDLQECDDETMEWLHFLLHFKAEAPFLVLATLRSEDLRPDGKVDSVLRELKREERVTEIVLGPLSVEAVGNLAEHILGRRLEPEALGDFYTQTAGNALFVVESARFGLTSEVSHEDRGLPPKIETVIGARLAQLPPGARALASLAAIIGETFSVDLLVCASGSSEDEVLRDLDLLWRRGIIREHAGDYLFAHPHIQAVALATVGAPERNRLNRRVARAIEQLYGTESASTSRRLASHYEDAALYDEAVAAYRRAAQAALEIYANEEAIRSIERALVLLAKLPERKERDRTELDLLMMLGPPLVITKGYAAPRAVEVYLRARELSRALGAPGLAAPALRGLAIAYIVRGELDFAEDMGTELLSLANKLSDPMLTVEAHYSLGVAAFWRGDFERSREELERAVGGCEQVDHAAHIALYSQSPLVIGLVRLGFTLWHLGFEDLALEKQARALALAEELGHPYSLGYALTFSAWLAHCRGADSETACYGERLIALCDEHTMRYWVPTARLLLGWSTMARGDVERGISLMQTTVEYIAEEDRLTRSFALTLLARGHARAGALEAAAALFGEARALVERTGVRWLEAELLRAQAEIGSAAAGGI